MAFVAWEQTFKRDGLAYKKAAVNVYFAGTTDPVRVFDVNDKLQDTAPQVYTDSDGYVKFQLDPDDFATGQLFDVVIEPLASCDTRDTMRLNSLMILQDTEGNRNFKNVYAQSSAPTSGMREQDIWFDTDDDNHPYRYDGSAWISMRDGGAAGTANWSEIIDDDGHKPADDADVTPLDRLFSDADARANIEAWQFEGDEAYIDGAALYAATVTAEKLAVNYLSAISANIGSVTAGYLTGVIITGALIRTAASGKRVEITEEGIALRYAGSSGQYGDFKYGAAKYGSGAIVYLHHTGYDAPFYVAAEQTGCGDLRLYPRSSNPTTGVQGELAMVDGNLVICTAGGTPGTWEVVGDQAS